MKKRDKRGQATYIAVLLLILCLILIIGAIIVINYPNLFGKNVQPGSTLSPKAPTSKECIKVLVPYTERETYFEKVPVYVYDYNYYNTYSRYDNSRYDNLNYKVWVDQDKEVNDDEVTEIITIKVKNTDNDNGYFRVIVYFYPENKDRVKKQETEFIREDETETFEFEYEHDEDIDVHWTYDITSESEYSYRYSGNDLYGNDYYLDGNYMVYDYERCFHGYCKPQQILTYQEVPRIRTVIKYNEVLECN